MLIWRLCCILRCLLQQCLNHLNTCWGMAEDGGGLSHAPVAMLKAVAASVTKFWGSSWLYNLMKSSYEKKKLPIFHENKPCTSKVVTQKTLCMVSSVHISPFQAPSWLETWHWWSKRTQISHSQCKYKLEKRKMFFLGGETGQHRTGHFALWSKWALKSVISRCI